ncbi:sodium-dependent phosphate transporter 2-like [Diadema antillarum]|uniref:sodium-dependent phosphate transporter 2-like n=1 Tax=Diadema antillarum TaxID=105358 RepID=UPI003A8B76C1
MSNYYAGDPTVMWIVVLAFIISFILAMGLGANDVANSFGTSVGAKVLTLYKACIIAAIFETGGAILLGYRVSDTIRKGLFNPELYYGREELLMVGNLCALAGSCIWLFTATALSVPVSATHSIVGASLGFHMVIFGGEGVGWDVVITIVVSWFVSPLFSGIVSSCVYGVLYLTVLKPEDPMKVGVYTTPFWYFAVIFVNFFSIFFGSSLLFGFDQLWVVFVIAIGGGLIMAGFGYFFVVPYTQRKIYEIRRDMRLKAAEEGSGEKQLEETEIEETNGITEGAANGHVKTEKVDPDHPDAILVPDTPVNGNPPHYDNIDLIETQGGDGDSSDEASKWMVKKGSKEWDSVVDTPEVRTICAPLQVVSACFAAFSHGGNDVSNAIGPLISLWIIFTTGSVSQDALTPVWILFYGGAGISVGLFLLGSRVIKTVGEDLTPMTPSNGFCIELGSAITVLLASNFGIPVSTTHCQVGSVCSIGWLRTRKAVDWPLFSGIFLAWVVTLPATIMLSAALMGLLQHTVPGGCDIQPIVPNITTTTVAAAAAAMGVEF